MLAQSVVAVILVLLGMMMGLGLVRLAANAVVMLLGVAACFYAAYCMSVGEWDGWLDMIWRSLCTGGVAALLCLPVLPFSSFHKRK